LVSSIEVLAEYRRVAERLHRNFSSIDIKAILDLVTRETRIVEPAPVPESACDDQSDLKMGWVSEDATGRPAVSAPPV